MQERYLYYLFSSFWSFFARKVNFYLSLFSNLLLEKSEKIILEQITCCWLIIWLICTTLFFFIFHTRHYIRFIYVYWNIQICYLLVVELLLNHLSFMLLNPLTVQMQRGQLRVLYVLVILKIPKDHIQFVLK